MKETVKEVEEYVKAKKGEIVLVDNASTGVNSVLRSLKLKKGDKLARFSIEYPMTRNTIDFVADMSGSSVLEISVPFPTTRLDMLRVLSETLKDKQKMENVKIFIFDHIT